MSIAQQKITPCLWFALRLDLQGLQDRQNWPLRKGGKAMLQMKKLDIAVLQKAAA
jgi:hypothetical protein